MCRASGTSLRHTYRGNEENIKKITRILAKSSNEGFDRRDLKKNLIRCLKVSRAFDRENLPTLKRVDDHEKMIDQMSSPALSSMPMLANANQSIQCLFLLNKNSSKSKSPHTASFYSDMDILMSIPSQWRGGTRVQDSGVCFGQDARRNRSDFR